MDFRSERIFDYNEHFERKTRYMSKEEKLKSEKKLDPDCMDYDPYEPFHPNKSFRGFGKPHTPPYII